MGNVADQLPVLLLSLQLLIRGLLEPQAHVFVVAVQVADLTLLSRGQGIGKVAVADVVHGDIDGADRCKNTALQPSGQQKGREYQSREHGDQKAAQKPSGDQAHHSHDDEQAPPGSVREIEIQLPHEQAPASHLNDLVLMQPSRCRRLHGIRGDIRYTGSLRRSCGMRLFVSFRACRLCVVRILGFTSLQPVCSLLFPLGQRTQVGYRLCLIAGIIESFVAPDDQIYITVMEFRGQGVQKLHILQSVRIGLCLVKCLDSIKVKSVVVSHYGRIAPEFALFTDQIIAQGNKGNGEEEHGNHDDRGKCDHQSFSKCHRCNFPIRKPALRGLLILSSLRPPGWSH